MHRLAPLGTPAPAWLLALSLCSAAAPAWAQDAPAPPLPGKLVGTWTRADGSSSGALSLQIDPATGKSKLFVQSRFSTCTVQDAPATTKRDGEKLLVQVDPSWSNFCRKDIAIELQPVADSPDYEGELRQGGRAAGSDPTLKVRVSP